MPGSTRLGAVHSLTGSSFPQAVMAVVPVAFPVNLVESEPIPPHMAVCNTPNPAEQLRSRLLMQFKPAFLAMEGALVHHQPLYLSMQLKLMALRAQENALMQKYMQIRSTAPLQEAAFFNGFKMMRPKLTYLINLVELSCIEILWNRCNLIARMTQLRRMLQFMRVYMVSADVQHIMCTRAAMQDAYKISPQTHQQTQDFKKRLDLQDAQLKLFSSVTQQLQASLAQIHYMQYLVIPRAYQRYWLHARSSVASQRAAYLKMHCVRLGGCAGGGSPPLLLSLEQTSTSPKDLSHATSNTSSTLLPPWMAPANHTSQAGGGVSRGATGATMVAEEEEAVEKQLDKTIDDLEITSPTQSAGAFVEMPMKVVPPSLLLTTPHFTQMGQAPLMGSGLLGVDSTDIGLTDPYAVYLGNAISTTVPSSAAEAEKEAGLALSASVPASYAWLNHGERPSVFLDFMYQNLFESFNSKMEAAVLQAVAPLRSLQAAYSLDSRPATLAQQNSERQQQLLLTRCEAVKKVVYGVRVMAVYYRSLLVGAHSVALRLLALMAWSQTSVATPVDDAQAARQEVSSKEAEEANTELCTSVRPYLLKLEGQLHLLQMGLAMLQMRVVSDSLSYYQNQILEALELEEKGATDPTIEIIETCTTSVTYLF